jgi:hypothetical protein
MVVIAGPDPKVEQIHRFHRRKMDMDGTKLASLKAQIEENRVKPIMCFCPFCGSYDVDPEGGLGQGKEGPYKFPVCEKCGATAPSVEIWNKRTITMDAIQVAHKYMNSVGYSPKHATVGTAIDKAMHSTADLASYATVADLLGCESTQDFEELKKTPVVETELGGWINREDGFFYHVRVADY